MIRIRFQVALLALFVAIVLISTSVNAGSGSQVQNGRDYYDIGGGYGPSVRYHPKGILLSDETDPGYAIWQFQINPTPATYNVSASVLYTETAGDGPTISLYNWTSASWDAVAVIASLGIDITKVIYAPSMTCVDPSGYVRVEVYADIGEFIDVGTVSVNWMFDDTPPSNPSSNSSTPSVGTWTSDNTVQVSWFGASDDISGVAGYSIAWSESPATLPDTSINTPGTVATSPPLADGIWYLHIRTVDNAGNWNSTSYLVGPFDIDTTPPTNPNHNTSAPSTNVWSSDNTISVTWSGATDDGSGVQGYSLVWSQDPSTIPDSVLNTTGTSTTSSALSDGTWYLHIRTVDNAGNWNDDAYHVGPFSMDTTKPTNPTDNSSNPLTGVWSNDNTVVVTWSGATDAGSGVYGYAFAWSQDPATVPDATLGTTGTSTASPPLTDGLWYLHVRSTDNAGMWADDAYHIGPFKIDITAPDSPVVQGPTPWSNVSTPAFDWTPPADTSGILGYSYSVDSAPDDVIDTTSLSVVWTPLPDGAHDFYIKACDQANNWGLPASYSFALDTVVPTVAISSPIDGTIQNISTVDVSWTGSDSLSGIDHYEVQIDSGSPVNAGTNSSYQFVGVPDGAHTIKVTAIDRAGNQKSASISLIIDTVAPVTTLSTDGTMGSDNWYVTPLNVTLNSSDTTTGVKSISYNLDSGGWQIYGGPIPIAANGVHTLQYYAEDFAGNREPVSTFEIKIDTTQFSLSFSVQNGTIFNTNQVAIAWTVHNAASGIDHFEYNLDGGSFESLGTVSSVGLVNLSEGSHVLTVRAYDNAGKVVSQSLTFTVDTQPPSLSFEIMDGTLFSSSSVTINWTSTDNSSGIDHFAYSLDSGASVTTGNVSSVSLTGVSDGSHSLTVRAYDKAGNLVERSITFRVDTQQLVLTFSGQGVAYFKSTSVTITWTVSNSVSGISRFESSLDNGTFTSFGTSSSRRIDLANVTEGRHLFTLRVYDQAGNLAEKSLIFFVDLQPPTLAFSIQNGTAFTSRPVTIEWSSTDNGSGIDRFEYKLDSHSSVAVGIETSADLVGISEGSHALTVFAYDKAGNVARSQINFIVDTQPPSIKFDARDGDFFNLVSSEIAWSSSDNVSGVDHFTYRIDSGSFQLLGNVSSVSLLDLADGTHVLIVRAYDKVGNVAEKFITFAVDTQPPLLSFDIRDGATISSWDLTIRFSSEDTGSGIDHFEYSVDNSTFKSIGLDRFVKLTNLKEGIHVLTIRSFDVAGNVIEKSVTFNVTAVGSWLFIILVIIVAAVILSVFVGMRRRKKSESAAPPSKPPESMIVEYNCKECGKIFEYTLLFPLRSDLIVNCQHCGSAQAYDPSRVESVQL